MKRAKWRGGGVRFGASFSSFLRVDAAPHGGAGGGVRFGASFLQFSGAAAGVWCFIFVVFALKCRRPETPRMNGALGSVRLALDDSRKTSVRRLRPGNARCPSRTAPPAYVDTEVPETPPGYSVRCAWPRSRPSVEPRRPLDHPAGFPSAPQRHQQFKANHAPREPPQNADHIQRTKIYPINSALYRKPPPGPPTPCRTIEPG